MGQQLILPINKCKLTASMKTDAYRNKFGFTHYGVDMVGPSNDRTLYASGNGTVVAVGKDSVVGNVVVVRYMDAINHQTGKAQDVIFRYCHLESIAVKSGQMVNKEIKLGIYGNTGSMVMGVHLHLEADTDTDHPLHSPTVKNSSLLKGTSLGANDKTMTNPLDWLHIKTDALEKQTYTNAENEFIKPEDKKLPEIITEPTQPAELDRLREENVKLQQDVISLNAKVSALEAKLEKVKQAVA